MSLLDDVSLMITPNGVAEDVLFGVLPEPTFSYEKIDLTTGATSEPSEWGSITTNGIKKLTGGSASTYYETGFTVTTGKTYEASFTLSDYSGSGAMGFSIQGGVPNTIRLSGNGSVSGYFTATANAQLQLYGSSTNTGTFSDVSVKEVTTSDMDFTRATTATRNGFSVNTTINPTFDTTIDLGTAGSGWKGNTGGDSTVAYSNGGVKLTRVGSGASKLRVRDSGGSTSGMKIGSKYKLVYDVVENNGCSTLRYYNGATQTVVSDSIGTHTSYFTQTSTGTWQIENVTNDSNITLDNIYLYELLVEDVPRNLLEYSEDLTNSFWNAVNSDTIVASTIPSPDGATFGFKAIPNTSSAHHYIDYDYNNLSVSAGTEVTYSVYVKPFGYTNFQLAPSTGFNSGSFVLYQNFELTGDGVKGTGNVNGATIEKIGDWYRCSITETATDTGPRVLNLALPSSGLGRNPTFEGSGNDGLLLWGGQIEKGTLATAYIPTTDRLNVPRLDYTGGECPHILVEPQRENICLRSEEMDKTTWSKSNGSTGSAPVVTANNVVSPDGTQNAEKVVFDLNGGGSGDESIWSLLMQNYTSVSGNTYTISCYLKGASGGEQIILDVDSQNGNVVTLTTDWVRYSFSRASTTSGTRSIRFGSRGNNSGGTYGSDNPTVYMWGCQLEVGAYATSYIPTTSASVTRNKDVFTRTGIADLIGTAGVLYLEVASIGSSVQESIALSDGTTDNRVLFYYSAGGGIAFQLRISGSSVASGSVTGTTETDFHKFAIRYQDDSFQLFIDGVKKKDVAGTFTVPAFDRLLFDNGAGTGASAFYGKIRNLQLYKTALTEAKCISLTT